MVTRPSTADTIQPEATRTGLGAGTLERAVLDNLACLQGPEALETWGVPLFQSLLPRPLEIVHEINRRFLEEVRERIHEYKRQHLNVLHIVTLYQRLRRDPQLAIAPRCFVFGGKAAPGYQMAKLMIRLINGVAAVVNQDPVLDGRLKVAFFPDFNVKSAHAIYPAADLSEQISTAGKEASGTGNMKFTLNGALTIGTLDGANVEIREEVSPESFFLFGLTAPEVTARKAGGYRPRDHYESDPELRAALDLIGSGVFSGGDPGLFRPLLDHLLEHDDYLLLADYRAYVDAQAEVDRAFRDPERWTRLSILNVARAGKFSSDRSIREYAAHIWGVKPVRVQLQ